MNPIKFFLSLSFSFLIMTACYLELSAQATKETKQPGGIQQALDAKNFVFVARSVTPQQGSIRQLTTNYELRVSNDSLICNLPYFGRAYAASAYPSSGGLDFTSTSFGYQVIARKKGGWDVIIKPNDKTDVQQLRVSVFENGFASLQVTSTNRQAISFTGNLTALKMQQPDISSTQQ